jgi:hypothetical protein
MSLHVTPKEHSAPNAHDVHQGIIAYKIAAHAADIARHRPGARDRDDAPRTPDTPSTEASSSCPRPRMGPFAARPDLPEDYSSAEFCSMCGPKFCSMRISQEVEELPRKQRREGRAASESPERDASQAPEAPLPQARARGASRRDDPGPGLFVAMLALDVPSSRPVLRFRYTNDACLGRADGVREGWRPRWRSARRRSPPSAATARRGRSDRPRRVLVALSRRRRLGRGAGPRRALSSSAPGSSGAS